MFKVKRIPVAIAGIIFLLSGLGKLNNVLGFQYLIVEYGLGGLNLLAPFIIITEILIGTLLIINVHAKSVSICAIILLCVFTTAFTYAYITHGITDCGCFGSYMPLQSTPANTYIRNTILLILLIYIIICEHDTTSIEKWKVITIITIMFSSTFVAGMTYKPFAFIEHHHPYENHAVNETPLSEYSIIEDGKSKLIMFFS